MQLNLPGYAKKTDIGYNSMRINHPLYSFFGIGLNQQMKNLRQEERPAKKTSNQKPVDIPKFFLTSFNFRNTKDTLSLICVTNFVFNK